MSDREKLIKSIHAKSVELDKRFFIYLKKVDKDEPSATELYSTFMNFLNYALKMQGELSILKHCYKQSPAPEGEKENK